MGKVSHLSRVFERSIRKLFELSRLWGDTSFLDYWLISVLTVKRPIMNCDQDSHNENNAENIWGFRNYNIE